MTVRIVAEGLGSMKRYLEALPDVSKRAAALALNRVAEGPGKRLLEEGIEAETAFPEGYVAPRIQVTRKAYNHRLEAVLAARPRPTSLARFARGQRPGGPRGRGVRVTVNPGSTQEIPRGFLIRLRAGRGLSDENFNVGLAIRLRQGERITGKRTSVEFAGGLSLLYGPSVNQVMRDVADEKAPEIFDAVENEFLRQFNRLADGV